MNNLFDRWLFLFISGLVCINYPFITIFNKPILIAGIPLIVIYFIAGWLISIIVIFIFVKLFK